MPRQLGVVGRPAAHRRESPGQPSRTTAVALAGLGGPSTARPPAFPRDSLGLGGAASGRQREVPYSLSAARDRRILDGRWMDAAQTAAATADNGGRKQV